MAACGTGASDRAWNTDDLRYVPLVTDEGPMVYVDTQTGKQSGYVYGGSLFSDGCALVHSSEGGWQYVDYDLEPLTGESYYDATNFCEGMAWVAKPGGPLTAIDKKGCVLFEFKQAECAYAFHEGLAVFRNAEGLYGLVDKKGHLVAEPQWADVGPMVAGGLLTVKSQENGKWGIVNRKGETVVDCRFASFGEWTGEQAFVNNYMQALREKRIPFKDASGKWGVIDAEGNYRINPQFDGILLDGDNYMFRKARLIGWCDKNGKYLINPQFRDAQAFGDNAVTAVENKDRDWGYIDKKGQWVIQPRFSEARPFLACGIAPVRDEDSRDWGAIDKSGKWVINPQFAQMIDYGADDRLIVADQSDNVGIIGTDGHYVVSPVYDDVSRMLVDNVSGIGLFHTAQSDYVDVAHYAELIEAQILALRKSTAGQLKTTYGLKESKFPKGGGTMTLSKKKIASDMTAKVTVAGISAWSKKSDGWFGYNYTFLPDTPVERYVLGIEFDDEGKAWRFIEEIFGELKKKYAFDEEDGTLSVPGYSLVFCVVVRSGGMVFHVNPE